MDAFLTLFGVTALAFASTNLDNLLLLVGWRLGRVSATGQLFVGYVLGMLGDLIVRVGRHEATEYARATAVEVT